MMRQVSQSNEKSISTMAKAYSEAVTTAAAPCTCKSRRKTPSLHSPKLHFPLLAIFAVFFILLHLHITTQWREAALTTTKTLSNCTVGHQLRSKLRLAVTFLPLKDLRYASKPLDGHTWFMSSTLDQRDDGEVQHQQFPSNASKARILCLKGGDKHDGAWNSYALAWPQTLPPNATFLNGLTFVSYNHYDYDNIWHGLSAAVPFVAWHVRNRCAAEARPRRWILYHRGELRTRMGTWVSSLMEAAFGEPLNVVGGWNETTTTSPACFEKAVVMRHNEGGMSRERRLEVYDFLRCKARVFCNVSRSSNVVNGKGIPVIGVTMFMRTGARSFKNQTAAVRILSDACREVVGCRLTVAYANNLTFCEQVALMSATDVLVSPHGAQLSNMFVMDRNSSVMEFFPKGWLKLAGIGQYVYHWMASWSGMNHRGAWRDPAGDPCPFPDDDRRCMSLYKNARIGLNHTYFYEWAINVLTDVKLRKSDQNSTGNIPISSSCHCG